MQARERNPMLAASDMTSKLAPSLEPGHEGRFWPLGLDQESVAKAVCVKACSEREGALPVVGRCKRVYALL